MSNDNEIWVKTYLTDLYEVSNEGRVRRVANNKILKSSINSSGYLKVTLSIDKKVSTHYVHRLVMLTFQKEGWFKGAIVNHMDGNKLNNRLDNFEWITVSENTKHAYATGLINKKKNAKLNIYDARIIRHLYKSVPSYQVIADIFEVHHKTIWEIIHNKIYVE